MLNLPHQAMLESWVRSWGRYIRGGPQASGTLLSVLGNLLTFRGFISLSLFGIAVLSAQLVRADCECPPDSVEQAIVKADRIFRGEVVWASISEDGAHSIEFVVKVDEAIRGIAKAQYRLTTALPDSCGVSVRLGFHDIYILGHDETTVSRCKGSGRDAYMKHPLLETAIALVDLLLSDARGAQRLLSEKFYSSYDRTTVDEFFELVERIDPTGNTASGTDDRIEYRGIAVLFTDGKYEKVETL